MNYSVVVTENAKDNLRAAYLRAGENAPDTAARALVGNNESHGAQ